jgi:hypothetical protein
MKTISIKNLAGDIIIIENIENIIDIKKEYIKYVKIKNDEIIDIDKLVFLDSNGNELWLGMKLHDILKTDPLIYAFITPPYIISECLNMISPMSLPNDSISYFVFTYEKNKIGHPIVLSIGNIDITFHQELGRHCIKYDPIKKNIFYNSKSNSKNSRLIELNIEDNEDKIRVDIGDIGERRHKPIIKLREPLRNEVEKIDTDLIFYKCTRIKLDS